MITKMDDNRTVMSPVHSQLPLVNQCTFIVAPTVLEKLRSPIKRPQSNGLVRNLPKQKKSKKLSKSLPKKKQSKISKKQEKSNFPKREGGSRNKAQRWTSEVRMTTSILHPRV